MKLSKTTGHAIRILLDCATSDGQLAKTADISERQDLTLQNTFKVAHLLKRAGFLKSVRGPHGGVKLAMPPSNIRIGDVVRAMETLKQEAEDPDLSRPASFDALFDDAFEAFISVLDGYTLQDMINNRRDGQSVRSTLKSDVAKVVRRRQSGLGRS
jgi:Rrf2 family protein